MVDKKPLHSRRFMRLAPLLVLNLGVLAVVELLQLVTRVGIFDVDDLILNLLGAHIGFVLLKRLKGTRLWH